MITTILIPTNRKPPEPKKVKCPKCDHVFELQDEDDSAYGYIPFALWFLAALIGGIVAGLDMMGLIELTFDMVDKIIGGYLVGLIVAILVSFALHVWGPRE